MNYMKWELGDWSNNEKKSQLNEGFNADYLIIGTISKLLGVITIDITAENLNTFAVVGSADTSIKNNDDPNAKIDELVTGIVRTMTGGSAVVRAGAVPDGFVRVEGGTFTMGSPSSEKDRSSDESQHQVTVGSFTMGKYEVTQKEWVEVMGNNPSNFKGDTLPVETVSWNDAVEYCNKRSIKEGLVPAYRGSGNNITCDFGASGYRLPTEAEWEFAARGGTKDYLTTEYSGSNNVDAVGWYDGNSGGKTHPVGTKQANSLGLYDMSGNVYEWCWDWYGGYSSGSQSDPRGAVSGSSRVVRGGSWNFIAQCLRSADRGNNTPSDRGNYLGFRLVRP
jgi:formylglycine-generating enzyme required for sulfatase activity